MPPATYDRKFVADFLAKLYFLCDQVSFYCRHPKSLQALLHSHPFFFILIMSVFFLIILLFILIIRKKPAAGAEEHTQKIEVSPISPPPPSYKNPLTVEPMRSKIRFQDKDLPQFLIQAEHSRSQSPLPPPIQELSLEEEQALNQAIALAGKQALAEFTGAPHQTEFFHHDEASEAAKKMFARQKDEGKSSDMEAYLLTTESEPVSFQPKNQPLEVIRPPQNDFIMLYFMPPRSQAFEAEALFHLFQDQGLAFNEQCVFEYTDAQGLEFYVASALKPGLFDLRNPHDVIPGLSFVIDLQTVQNGKHAFQTMLKYIDIFSQTLKGDLLDENRQRLNQSTINAYLTRIRSFTHLQNKNSNPR